MSDDKKPVATLKFSVDYDHVPDSTEVKALMDASKLHGMPRDAKLSIHRRVVTDVKV